jgi:hypothetical protein
LIPDDTKAKVVNSQNDFFENSSKPSGFHTAFFSIKSKRGLKILAGRIDKAIIYIFNF